MRLGPTTLRLLLALAVLLLPGGAALRAQQPGGGVPVTTDAVQVGPVPVEILANGIVASESVVTVRTRVDGQITEVHVTEGQLVLDQGRNAASQGNQQVTLGHAVQHHPCGD